MRIVAIEVLYDLELQHFVDAVSAAALKHRLTARDVGRALALVGPGHSDPRLRLSALSFPTLVKDASADLLTSQGTGAGPSFSLEEVNNYRSLLRGVANGAAPTAKVLERQLKAH